MHRLQVLSLTAFMLMLPSRLPAQTPVDHDWDAQIVVCNDGKIGVDVVRAYRHPDYFRQEIREMSVCPVFFLRSVFVQGQISAGVLEAPVA